MKLKPKLNSEGKNEMVKLDKGIVELRRLIKNHDVKGLSDNFEKVGAKGMENVERIATDPDLKKVFSKLAEKDHATAKKLKETKCSTKAAKIVCDTLNEKARIINKFFKK